MSDQAHTSSALESWHIGLYTDVSRAESDLSGSRGLLCTATSAETAHLPFAAMLLMRESGQAHADAGHYLVTERTIKNLPLASLDHSTRPGTVGIFPMVANAELGVTASDDHWRDSHAPLALRVHTVMTHYYQLTVREVFDGPAYNGFAFCCCASEDDLRNNFFANKEGRRAVMEDIVLFSDAKKSPRRVIADMKVSA